MENTKKHEEVCAECHEKQAHIPFFIHENAMMHKDMDNERMERIVKGQRITNIVQSVVILLIVFIMAMFYTSRTQMWNDTISKLNQTIVEVTHAKEDRTP